MPKPKSLTDELKTLKPPSRNPTWLDRVAPEVQQEIRGVAAALKAGEITLPKKTVARWLIERLQLTVGSDSVVRTLSDLAQ